MDIQDHQYTNGINHAKVLLVGIFAPPLGGISVHLRRVQGKLELQGCQVLVWDVRYGLGIAYYWHLWRFILKNRPEVIVYHTMQLRSYPLELLLLVLASWWVGSKMIVMIHSARFIYRLSWLSRRLTSFILGFCDQLVLVSRAQEQEIGAKIDLTKLQGKISLESPFLPPDLSADSQILANLPTELLAFMQNYYPIITCAITRYELWQGGDLYGVDLALAAFKRLLHDYPKAGLILVISSLAGYEELKNESGVYLLISWPEEMWPLIGKSQLFIRPTRSDGNAISVQEALSLNVPVVASDVCARPAGVILFKSGDAQDLYLKMGGVLLKKSIVEKMGT